MRLFSKGSEYAILALMRVLEQDATKGFSAAEICGAAGVPEFYGRKALAALAKAGVLDSRRGVGGGFSLARPTDEITLLDIVLAVDGRDTFQECPLGYRCVRSAEDCTRLDRNDCTSACPDCGVGHICPLHGLWGKARGLVTRHLASVTLRDMQRRLFETPVP